MATSEARHIPTWVLQMVRDDETLSEPSRRAAYDELERRDRLEHPFVCSNGHVPCMEAE